MDRDLSVWTPGFRRVMRFVRGGLEGRKKYDR